MKKVLSKHVTVICDLEVGQKCELIDFGYKHDGKIYTITDIKYSSNCQSNFLVKVDGYDNYIDSDWITLK